ncbi:hypothetical protein EV356DRAFT_581009 [Viridothelium virens]|uniref:Uncharacterized protein n=1 Tax=Viridothelium virens TaxID=1048519 RepID=A0A6A6GTW4_VIRVR|nr:hypothetical protein EV356DRAFT_581009 [Viridothelium virens]
MHYAMALSLLALAVPAIVTANASEKAPLLPTMTVPFLPAWQQWDELAAMATPICQKIPRVKEDQLPLDDAGEDCHDQMPLQRRQNNNECPTSYSNCYGQGAPGLCCQPSAVCSADMAGHVACCPVGAACTGTIVAVNTASQTSTSTFGVNPSTTTTTNGFSSLSATSTSSPAATTSGGFIITASDASLTYPKFPGFHLLRIVSSTTSAIWAAMLGTE